MASEKEESRSGHGALRQTDDPPHPAFHLGREVEIPSSDEERRVRHRDEYQEESPPPGDGFWEIESVDALRWARVMQVEDFQEADPP